MDALWWAPVRRQEHAPLKTFLEQPLFRLHGTSPAGGDRPPQFDQIRDGGRGIAGSPATVTRMVRSQMEEAGTNYFVGQFAFGNLTLTEVMRTVELFAREVMPALKDA
jgi:hypothetical protein